MIDTSVEAQKLTAAIKNGSEAVKTALEDVIGRVIEEANLKVELGSSLSAFNAEIRKAESCMTEIAMKLFANGFSIDTHSAHYTIRQGMIAHRQRSPHEPNWTPEGKHV